MEDIDVRLVISRFLSKWPFFAFSLLVALLLAFVYLQLVEEKFLVQASVQLKDEGLSEKGDASEKFINGLELLESDSQLEDEIATLSSYSTISQAIKNTGRYTDLYRYASASTPVNKYFAKEIYDEDLTIRFDSLKPQLVNVPVHLSFVDKNNFVVEVDAEDCYLYSYQHHKTVAHQDGIVFSKKGKINEPFVSPFLNFTLMPADGPTEYWKNQYYFKNYTLKDLAESYQGQLAVIPVAEGSNIVNVKLQGPIADKEVVFLNGLINVYVTNNLEKKNRLALKTIDFINQQLYKVSDTLQTVESSLEQFRTNSKVVDINVSSESLTDLWNQLMEKQIERKTQNAYFQYIAKQIDSSASLTSIVAPSAANITDPTFDKLLGELNDLNREKVNIAYNSNGENHPLLKLTNQKIVFTKRALKENVRNLVYSTSAAIKENQIRLDEIEQRINKLPTNERQLNNIQRKFDLNDNVFKYLLQKQAEASIAMASNTPDKEIIDPARKIGRKAVAPNTSVIYLMAFMVGLIIPAGIISVQDYFTRRVKSEEQVEKKSRIPVIATISYDHQPKSFGAVAVNPLSDSAFQAIRYYARFKNHQVIGVTSMAGNEGKTYCAINLAVAFAKGGHKTLLIDTDFYKSDVSTLFNLDKSSGLINFMQNESKVRIDNSSVKNLDIIGAGQASQNSRAIFLQNSLQQLFEKLRQEYTYIIVDTCPVGIISDYLLFADYLDYTMVVVRDNVTNWKDINRLNKLFDSHNFNNKSAVIYNGTKTSKRIDNYYKNIAS